MTREARALCTLSLASLAAGCIPRGDPPAGQQILADRNASLLELVPSTDDGVVRVLFFRPNIEAGLVDLWAVSVDASGNPFAEHLLYVGINDGYQLSQRPTAESGAFQLDAKGRVYVFGTQIDPATGQARDLGVEESLMSASRQRVLIQTRSGGWLVNEDDDSTTALPDAAPFARFAGETLFYLTTAGDLMRSLPGASPERLTTGISFFSFVPAHEQQLLLTKANMDPNSSGASMPSSFDFSSLHSTSTLFDLTTLEEAPLPSGPKYDDRPTFSPDGRWVVVPQYGDPGPPGVPIQMDSVLVDLMTGTVETLNGAFLYGQWRPGHEELWAASFDDTSTDVSGWTLWIKKPGQPMVAVPALNVGGFTDDGTYFFSTNATLGTTMADSNLVGVADDPTGPRLPLVPTGSSLMGRWAFGDDRLLVESLRPGSDGFEDFYLQVVNPGNGAAHLFGEHGIASAVGRTRVLGVVQISFERGDLTTYDLPTDRTTVVAPEFAMAAVAEPQGTDAYPPGGRVVYQYRARYESPWDGLWLTRVP